MQAPLAKLCSLIAVLILPWAGGPVWGEGILPLGGKRADLKNVKTPTGCSLFIEDGGNLCRYVAPAKNFEEPIHIQFQEQSGTKRPDILVWADEIRWHADVQSGTASGRIIVDDQAEYRVETTYAEYDHTKGRVNCPRKTIIYQKAPDGSVNHMVAESVALLFDEKGGVKSANFNRILDSKWIIPEGKNNPFKSSKPKGKGKEAKAEKKKEAAPEKAAPVKDEKKGAVEVQAP